METQKKSFFKKPQESDARSESDAASGRSSGSEMEETVSDFGGNVRSFRKRSKSGDGSSTDEGKGSAPKIPTSSRGGSRALGKGRGRTAQESAQRADRLAAEGRHPGTNSAGAGASQPSGSEPDVGADSVEESRKRLGELVVEALTAMTRKREKGSKKRGVAKFATSILEAIDATFELSLKKLRAELTGTPKPDPRVEEVPKEGGMQGQRREQPQPQPEPESQLLTVVRQELAAFRQQQQEQLEQVQLRMQQQLSVLEGIVLRPPLAASGQRKTASYAAAAAAPKAGPSWARGRDVGACEVNSGANQQRRRGSGCSCSSSFHEGKGRSRLCGCRRYCRHNRRGSALTWGTITSSQANLNHCAPAQDLLLQSTAQWSINIAVVSAPYYVLTSGLHF